MLRTVRGRVLSLMIFKIHPLRFVTYFHIDKHVCFFSVKYRTAGNIGEEQILALQVLILCSFGCGREHVDG